MGEHTIKASYGLDTKQAKEALDDIKRHAERHGRESGGFGKLFALEPLGIRRGEHALQGLAEGFTDVAEGGRDALSSVTQFGRALSLGLGAGVAVGIIGVLAEKFVAARQEALELDETVHKIENRSQQSGHFQGIATIQKDIADANTEADALSSTLTKMGKGQDYSGVGGALRGFGQGKANEMQAFLHGFSSVQEYAADLEEKRARVVASISRDIDKETEKLHEASDIEEKRYRVSEREAQLKQEEIRHNEQLGVLAEQTKITGSQNLSALHDENRIHEERTKRINESQDAIKREADTRLRSSEIAEKMAVKQRDITNLQVLGLTKEQQSLAAARAGVDVAGDKQRLAEAELAAAEKEVDASRNLNDDEKAHAQERLNKARAGVEQAKGGVTNAAASAASVEEGQQLEKGREEEMSEREKSAQLSQRQKQRDGLIRSFARQGLNSNLIDSPKYGEAEYDPLARFRAVRAQQMQQQEQQKLAEEKAQQQAQDQDQTGGKQRSEEQAGLASRYGQTHDMTGVDPAKAAQIQRGIEANDAQQKAIAEANRGDNTHPSMFSHSSARDKLPKDDSELAHQMDSAPWRNLSPWKNRPLEGDTFPAPSRDDQAVPQPAPPPPPSRTSTPQASAAPLTQAGLDAVLAKYWGA